MPKIVHLITGLGNGGAEGVLFRLCVNDVSNTHVVISMTDGGRYGPLLQDFGISVFCLNMSRDNFPLLGPSRLFGILRSHKPDVLQTWMPHADLMGALVGAVAGVPRIYWNIRNGKYDPRRSKARTRLVVRLLALLSWTIPSKIVVCAKSALDEHVKRGFRASKMVLIPNGFESNPKPLGDRDSGKFSAMHRSASPAQVIGMLARFDAQKDHLNFLKALQLIRFRNDDVVALLAGPGVDQNNSYLTDLLEAMGLAECVVLMGAQEDVRKFMMGIDIHVLSSRFGEAFPNVLAEAMLYGVPCISTDVGDARHIIGTTGWVVPTSDSLALADAISLALSLDEEEVRQLGRRARERIEAEFSLEKMANSYAALYSQPGISD